MRTPSIIPRGAGFTLVEVMVSMAIVTLLLLVLVSITDSTQKTWLYTTTKVSQFRDAREAFEAITRKLSQSTLNTYLDYDYPTDASGAPDKTQPPKRYARQSELRFISGIAGSLLATANAANCPTHAIFFMAPLGFTDEASYSDLNKLLNTCGYYIEFGSDSQVRPDFLKGNVVPLRYRFRLMEMVEPAESLTLYKYTNANPTYADTQWFNDPLSSASPPAQVRAENIVALVILPKLTPEEDPTGIKLASHYTYDSTKTDSDASINPKNQLPPVIQVTMVAVDEASFSRLQASSTSMPDLFSASPFTDAARYDKDLEALETTLRAKKLNYRVFTTNISLKAAKWSREQQN